MWANALLMHADKWKRPVDVDTPTGGQYLTHSFGIVQ
jgi:hypothetical protein